MPETKHPQKVDEVTASPPPPVPPLGFVFSLWKAILLLLALVSSLAPSYDTSTSLYFNQTLSSFSTPTNDGATIPPAHPTVSLLFSRLPFIPTLTERLTRWDALYFVSSARHGYRYEQEWAFAKGQPFLVATLLNGCQSMSINLGVHADQVAAAMGVVVAVAAHLYAVVALRELVREVSGSWRLAYLVGGLHVLSPAGIFLAAPYAEAPFAYLAFTGLLRYAEGLKSPRGSWMRNKATVWSGLLLGMATACRSNGLLYGIVFGGDLAEGFVEVVGQGFSFAGLTSLVATGVAGVFVGLGSVGPQVAGYLTFCGEHASERREWCDAMIPSIYSYVQRRYWNVGFLQYWVPENIPLFALALPMLYILIKSSWEILATKTVLRSTGPTVVNVEAKSPYSMFVKSLAAGQLILAVMAFFSYHVQIITRISSGYPLWYIWVAEQLASKTGDCKATFGKKVVMYMVSYALIQSVLYACFLPPA